MRKSNFRVAAIFASVSVPSIVWKSWHFTSIEDSIITHPKENVYRTLNCHSFNYEEMIQNNILIILMSLGNWQKKEVRKI